MGPDHHTTRPDGRTFAGIIKYSYLGYSRVEIVG